MQPASFPRITPASDQATLVTFGDQIGLDCHRDVLRFMTVMQRAADRFVRNLHPAYASVLVSFDPRLVTPVQLEAILHQRLLGLHEVELPAARSIEIPVCYAPEFGPDLADVAASHRLTAEEVVRLHCEPEYRVDFLGFSPGFPYLSGLSPQLATPRLATPRTRVPAGSVAIGGAQTGIYPLASPGGWRILGRTSVRLFDPEKTPATLLQIGDRVTFRSITRAEFETT